MANGILTLGEALVDMIPLDTTNHMYQKCPGGAPANVAVGVARLGASVAFIGKVGQDLIGDFLIKTLHLYNVDTSYLTQTCKAKTGLVFVNLDANGERSFEFYVNPSADCFLTEKDIENVEFGRFRLLHFGSISLIHEPARTATYAAVRKAKKNGLIVSFDPNIRINLWSTPDIARQEIETMMFEADVVKLSDDELDFLTGNVSLNEAKTLIKRFGMKILIVTFGKEGCWVINSDGHANIPSLQVQAVDTTGAGDAFVSGFLFHLQQTTTDIASLSIETLAEYARFAVVSGGLAVSAKGAMTALPTRYQIEERLKEISPIV